MCKGRAAAAALLGLVLVACSDATPRNTQHSVPAAAQPFNVGLAVPGPPDPHDPQFLRDQQNLYDPTQFGNSLYYQSGYHWKIDPGIGPHAITHADVVYDPQARVWAVTITFTAAAARSWATDTTAAYNAGQSSPLNRIAIFVGNRVVSAPNVQAPSSSNTQITGNFTQQTAQSLADAISAAART